MKNATTPGRAGGARAVTLGLLRRRPPARAARRSAGTPPRRAGGRTPNGHLRETAGAVDGAALALPGNPASVFSCYHQYVKPFLLGCFGRKELDEEQDFAISESFAKKKNKDQTQFLKAFYTKGKVLILNAQESYKMDSVAQANCLVEFPEGATEINIGEKVKIWKV